MQVTTAQKFNLKFTHSKLLILNLSKRKCLLKPYNIYLFYIFLLKKKRKLQSIIPYCIILSADRAAKKESQVWTKLISLETITPVIRIGQGKILYK